MCPYDAILFDFDGVLVDTEPLHFQSWCSILAESGVLLTWNFYEQHCRGVTTDGTIQALSTLAHPVLSFETLSAYRTEKQRRFLSLAQQSPPLESEVKTFVQSLSLRFNLAVVTSSSRTEVKQILAAAAMLDYFTATVCAEDVARHKPDPAPYQVAARILRAERALVIEDSPAGIESGRAAGFDVAIVPSPTEMPRVVKKHLAKSGENFNCAIL